MKKILWAGLAVAIFASMLSIASADVMQPTLTTVQFSDNGEPYNGYVDFEVNCFGYSYDFDNFEDKEPGSYTPEEVYSYSASCPEYGCSIYEPYYLNYRHIDYCDLTADTDDGQYVLEKYATSPLAQCEDQMQFDMSTGDKYYRFDDEYDACIDETGDFVACDEAHRVEIPDSEITKDENGNPIERTCLLAVDFAENGDALFKDVDVVHSNYDAIKYVKDESIVQGYDDGTYRPDSNVNRAEFTKILVEAVYDDLVITDCINQHAAKYMITFGDAFIDVPATEWYSKYVCTAYANEIVEGYPDGTFKPGDNINFVEAAKIIVEAFDYTTEEFTGADWYVPYVSVLEDKFAIPTTIDDFSSKLTRGEMAEIIYRLKEGVMDKMSVFPSIEWE